MTNLREDYKEVKGCTWLVSGCHILNRNKVFVAKKTKLVKYEMNTMIERVLLRSLDHPNIVKNVDSFITTDRDLRWEDCDCEK